MVINVKVSIFLLQRVSSAERIGFYAKISKSFVVENAVVLKELVFNAKNAIFLLLGIL